MDYILQSLHELEGVNGAIVADEKGQILGWHAHPMYDAELLKQASKAVVSVVDSVKLLQEEWESFTGQFGEGKLLIRNLTDTSKPEPQTITLTVIADARLNVSMATVAIRVAVTKLKGALAKGIPSPVPLGTAQESATTAIGARVAPAPPNQAAASAIGGGGAGSSFGSAGNARSSSAEVATTGLSWSGLSGSSTTGSGVSVADSASAAFLTACTKALAKKVGPLAKVLVKEGVAKVSPEQPFSLARAKELILELEKHIKNPAEAQQFRQSFEKAL